MIARAPATMLCRLVVWIVACLAVVLVLEHEPPAEADDHGVATAACESCAHDSEGEELPALRDTDGPSFAFSTHPEKFPRSSFDWPLRQAAEPELPPPRT